MDAFLDLSVKSQDSELPFPYVENGHKMPSRIDWEILVVKAHSGHSSSQVLVPGMSSSDKLFVFIESYFCCCLHPSRSLWAGKEAAGERNPIGSLTPQSLSLGCCSLRAPVSALV